MANHSHSRHKVGRQGFVDKQHRIVGSKFSKNYIGRFFDENVDDRTSLIGKSKYDEISNDLQDKFKTYDTHHTVFIPLDGIKLQIRSLKIGRIRIRNLTSYMVQKNLGSARRVLTTSKSSHEARTQFMDKLNEEWSSVIGKPCAVSEVLAEPYRAMEIAEQNTRRAIDILKYHIFMVHFDRRTGVSLAGERAAGRRISTLFSDQNVTITHASTGQFIDFEINSSTINEMRSTGAITIANILKREPVDISDLEDSLLRSVHWVANSQIQSEDENRLLNLAVALETLLTPRSSDPIATSIAEAVAILIGRNLPERKHLKRLTKSLYNQRSAISHGGKTFVKRQDVRTLKNILYDTIKAILFFRNRFNTRSDLLEWIEEKKLE